MNAFDEGRRIERQGAAMIYPLLNSWAGPGRLYNNMNEDPEKQKRDGDFLIIKAGGRRIKIEFKTEMQNPFDNFFFETWSNLQKKRGKLGWVYTCKADGLLYLFQESRELYSIPWPACHDWLMDNLIHYKERRQSKHKQLNNTLGRLVPIKDLLDRALAKRLEVPG